MVIRHYIPTPRRWSELGRGRAHFPGISPGYPERNQFGLRRSHFRPLRRADRGGIPPNWRAI